MICLSGRTQKCIDLSRRHTWLQFLQGRLRKRDSVKPPNREGPEHTDRNKESGNDFKHDACGRISPNEKRSHAGPVASEGKRSARPALAAACGWAYSFRFLSKLAKNYRKYHHLNTPNINAQTPTNI
jgi:hypothetical protein